MIICLAIFLCSLDLFDEFVNLFLADVSGFQSFDVDGWESVLFAYCLQDKGDLVICQWGWPSLVFWRFYG